METDRSWNEGIPFVVFTAREAMQESLGFNHTKLVFDHTPRGPLKSLQEKFLSPASSPTMIVVDFVSKFRKHLHRAHTFARESLSSSQAAMKCVFKRSTISQQFQVGDMTCCPSQALHSWPNFLVSMTEMSVLLTRTMYFVHLSAGGKPEPVT